MNELEQAIARSLRQTRLLIDGERVVVAVSGGLDSMVLLHLLHTLANNRGWKLLVAHFNHRLRGSSSNADERLVCRIAAKLDLPFATDSADVRKLAAYSGVSIEMAARTARHQFMAGCAKKFGASKIAVAHHADDQLELFFLRLFRGSGSEALAGMKSRNPSPADRTIELVRPLLHHSREVLTAYAIKENIPFREDASNASTDIQRNRIRHKLLPLLRRQYQPALQSGVSRILEIVRTESDLTKDLAVTWLKDSARRKKNPQPFDNLHMAIQRRVIQLQLEESGIAADFALVEKLRCTPQTPVSVTRSASGRLSDFTSEPVPICVSREENGRLVLQNQKRQFDQAQLEISLESTSKSFQFHGLQIDCRVSATRNVRVPPRKLHQEWFDAEKVGTEIVLRHWQPGDRFHPIGAPNPLKLQDFFVNAKVPKDRRHELVLACTKNDGIFWVEGMRVSERFKLTDQTNRRLQWRWKRL
jgi:tRNA(Ile)-lysidine synthase